MSGQYPLVQSAAETDRLRRQHETWRSATERIWRLAGFGPGHTIGDLGCGPGFSSVDLAALVGASGRVVAIDASGAATAELGRSIAGTAPNLEIITADVGAVDLGAYAFDGLFARWLFCYLPRPAEVLRHVAGHLKPGGAIAILDYWNYLAIRTEPASPLFRRVFQAVFDSFRDAGGSLDVTGELPRAIRAAGLTVTHVEPVCAVGRPGSPVWRWIGDFQALYLPVLVEREYLARGDVDDYLAWWTNIERTGDGFVFAPPMLAVVGVRPAGRPL
jgi:SAM-dependent methyltransferase